VIVACVRTGNLYGPEYVHRLKRAVEKHLPRLHKFVCVTDNVGELGDVEMLFTKGLPGWWAKMRVFGLAFNERVLYFDLDTVIVGDLSPLADLDVPFGICENFTRLSVNPNWPCRFGSCVMTLAPGFGGDIWEAFRKRRHELMLNRYGDQKVIEQLCVELRHEPALLQHVLPAGYFVGYRDLPRYLEQPPAEASVVVFAGSHKPHNTGCRWARDAWAA
jgi:hypothetical protein